MRKEVVILLAEDDEGHAGLIKLNLAHGGIVNEVLHFNDGREVLDFLFQKSIRPQRQPGASFILLLDIEMPRIGGIEVLTQVKADPELCKIPVIMITTTDDPREVERCYTLGCNSYITKPINYEKFVDSIRQLGLFLAIVEVPRINGEGAV